MLRCLEKKSFLSIMKELHKPSSDLQIDNTNAILDILRKSSRKKIFTDKFTQMIVGCLCNDFKSRISIHDALKEIQSKLISTQHCNENNNNNTKSFQIPPFFSPFDHNDFGERARNQNMRTEFKKENIFTSSNFSDHQDNRFNILPNLDLLEQKIKNALRNSSNVIMNFIIEIKKN